MNPLETVIDWAALRPYVRHMYMHDSEPSEAVALPRTASEIDQEYWAMGCSDIKLKQSYHSQQSAIVQSC